MTIELTKAESQELSRRAIAGLMDYEEFADWLLVKKISYSKPWLATHFHWYWDRFLGYGVNKKS